MIVPMYITSGAEFLLFHIINKPCCKPLQFVHSGGYTRHVTFYFPATNEVDSSQMCTKY